MYVFITDVQFLNNTSSAFEYDGVISFTIISLVPSDKPFSVQVCTREADPLSAEGLLKVYVCFTTLLLVSHYLLVFTNIQTASYTSFTVFLIVHMNCFFHCTTADVDYITLGQVITFDSGETSKVFSVDIQDDQIAESDESFEVFLKPISNSPYDVRIDEASVAVGIIFDNEIPSKLLLAAYSYMADFCLQSN